MGQSTQINNFLRPDPCEKGTRWYDGCNYCNCEEEETGGILCTALMCERPTSCAPGEAYYSGSSWCFCHENPQGDVCKHLTIEANEKWNKTDLLIF